MVDLLDYNTSLVAKGFIQSLERIIVDSHSGLTIKLTTHDYLYRWEFDGYCKQLDL